jgi:hypothetical protein
MNIFTTSRFLFAGAVAVGMTAGALASVDHVAAAPAAKTPITLERVVIVGHRAKPTLVVLDRTLVVGRLADVRLAKQDSPAPHRVA